MSKPNPLIAPPTNLLTSSMAVLIIVASVFVRIRLLGVPIERDEGEYAYMAQLLLKGMPPYTYAYTMKLPGVAIIYAGIMAIFGQSVTSIHIGLLLINIACIALVYLLGKRFSTGESAITAAAFYALLSLSESVLGVFAHATHFVLLFSMLGIVLLARSLERQQTSMVFMSGTCFGMAVLMKQHAALMIVFALALQVWPQCKENSKLFARQCAVFLAGTIAPYAIVALWLYNAGVFEKFWFWTFRYASAYAAGLSISEGLTMFARQFAAVVKPSLPIWLIAGAGFAILWRGANPKEEKLCLSGYLVASFAMVCPGLYFRSHYFILLLPPIAILAGHAVQSTGKFQQKSLYKLLPPMVLVMATGCFCYFENDYLFRMPPEQVSRKVYGTNPFPEATRIADYLRRETTKADRIAILGSEPEILFHADRISATGHIYMYGLMEDHRYAGEMQQQLIGEIEATKPVFIVIVNNPASWLLRPNSVNKLLDWGDSYLPMMYEEVGIVEIFDDKPTSYLWGAQTAGYQPTAESFVSIFRRKRNL